MTREDLAEGIASAVVKAAAVRPDSDEELASWAQTLAVYLYEFVVRFNQRGLKRERAEELARQATVRKMRENKIHRLLEDFEKGPKSDRA